MPAFYVLSACGAESLSPRGVINQRFQFLGDVSGIGVDHGQIGPMLLVPASQVCDDRFAQGHQFNGDVPVGALQEFIDTEITLLVTMNDLGCRYAFDDVQTNAVTPLSKLIDSINQVFRSLDATIGRGMRDGEFCFVIRMAVRFVGPLVQVNYLLNNLRFRCNIQQVGGGDE